MENCKDRFGRGTQHKTGTSVDCGGSIPRLAKSSAKRRARFRSVFWATVFMVMLIVGSVRAADFVIVVDVSGSMAGAISSHDKRIRVAVVQEALRQYLPALPPGSRVDLIAFSSGIVSDQEVILNDKRDLDRALNWVDSLEKEARRNKDTYLWTTLRQALKTASRYSRENPDQAVTVRVLTDGEDNENATTLDKVLQEFLPVLDGEKIRSNIVLLGDMELKTKLSLPAGAFETTKNPTWEVLFPPIVLWAPAEPKIGEQVQLFENNTRSIYRDYEWQVDGATVGHEKVLNWHFKEPRSYRITLKTTGLQGTKNSATVLVRVKEKDKLVVDFVPSTSQPEPGQAVKFIGRCSSQGATFAWFVNSKQVAITQDLSFRFDKEGDFDIKLVASDAAGSSGVKVQTIQVKEQTLTASIKGPAEIVSGRTVQFAGEITGPYASVEWRFGDGAISTERNPQHTFQCRDSEFKDHTVSIRVVSPLGKVVESTPHIVRVWAEKKAPAPQAMFRILTQNPKVGDAIQLVDETTGPVDTVQWDMDGEAKGAARNPEIRVSTPGVKTVRMTVRGPGGESVATKKITVQPRYAQPVVSCEASMYSGTAPLTVEFTSRITGNYKSLLWTFSDGESSTDSNPRHTFATVKDYDVSLIVSPMDGTKADTVQNLVIKVTKPWPAWVKVTAVIIACLLPIIVAFFLIRRHLRKALRLPVYYWAEQAPTCQTTVLTKSDEVFELSPAAPLRIKREGKSQNLIIQPLEGATLFTASGQEASMLSIGDGLHVAVRDASGLTRAIAVSIRQKPSRPMPAMDGSEALSEGGECGLQNASESVPSSAGSDDLDWALEKTSST